MVDKKTPNPEQVQKEFEDFVRERFGDSAQVFTSNINEEPSSKSEPKIELNGLDFEFEYTPRQVKEYLDRFVIKQDEAKKALAIAVCDHYHHAAMQKRVMRTTNMQNRMCSSLDLQV